MTSNVITFKTATTTAANTNRTATSRTATTCPVTAARDNVISLASWIGRAMPRRTPNGVFFSTHVLMTTGELA